MADNAPPRCRKMLKSSDLGVLASYGMNELKIFRLKWCPALVVIPSDPRKLARANKIFCIRCEILKLLWIARSPSSVEQYLNRSPRQSVNGKDGYSYVGTRSDADDRVRHIVVTDLSKYLPGVFRPGVNPAPDGVGTYDERQGQAFAICAPRCKKSQPEWRARNHSLIG